MMIYKKLITVVLLLAVASCAHTPATVTEHNGITVYTFVNGNKTIEHYHTNSEWTGSKTFVNGRVVSECFDSHMKCVAY